ncbi:Dual specificity mitogen-activated protein kinase kinase 4 [Fasciola hepatica]|uniref:mitogen-activated protein kinase kinase n=1 Tax=Fasciola hepatica TaxID=6192 RepID=A0A4E0RB69_FASHE|nr:Dual specificity mitogen-activated protein kinase kinase 4 [Fasciola hepatica]
MASRPQLRLPLSNIQPRADPPICNIKHDSYNGKLTVPGVCRDTLFTAADLLDEGEIGRGAFGFVNRMTHTPTGVVMAVKRIRSTLNESEQTKTLKDLDVVVKSTNCTHIVRFYGALFQEGDCWICMEMMATSLDKFYKFVYRNLQTRIPETVLGKIATAVSGQFSLCFDTWSIFQIHHCNFSVH